jgi:hypothetical protein
VVKIGWKRGFGVVAVAAAALVVAGGTVAVADAARGKPVKRQVAKRLVRAGVHADVSLVRADGTTDAFAVDRGRVSTSTATSVTLTRADGKTVTLTLSASTIVRGTITANRPALVFSRNGAAFRVAAPGRRLAPTTVPPAASKSPIVHLQANFVRGDGSTGSATLDRGQVTAFSSTSLTIKRADGRSVTFTIGAAAVIRGKLAVGGGALVLSRAGAAVRVLARPAAA